LFTKDGAPKQTEFVFLCRKK